MKNEDFTLLIQGPLNSKSLQHLETYKRQFGSIVVSFWGDAADIKNFTTDETIDIIAEPLPSREGRNGIIKDSTFYWATRSIFNGLKLCDTKYVIKMRSDEYFTDFSLFKQQIAENPHSLVCGNIFFRSPMEIPYHIGDHVFGAQTRILKKIYKNLQDMQNRKIPLEPWAAQGPYPAESIVGRAFVICSGVPAESTIETMIKGCENVEIIEDLIKQTDKYFKIVDVNEMGEYEVKWAYQKQTWRSDGPRFNSRFCINNNKDLLLSTKSVLSFLETRGELTSLALQGGAVVTIPCLKMSDGTDKGVAVKYEGSWGSTDWGDQREQPSPQGIRMVPSHEYE